jgi:transposase InsO family protein
MCLTDYNPDKHAKSIAEAFYTRWLCRHGLPLEIVSGQGIEFSNKVVDKLLSLLKVKKSTITPYHPQTNAQVKVVNKTIDQNFKSQSDKNTLN